MDFTEYQERLVVLFVVLLLNMTIGIFIVIHITQMIMMKIENACFVLIVGNG